MCCKQHLQCRSCPYCATKQMQPSRCLEVCVMRSAHPDQHSQQHEAMWTAHSKVYIAGPQQQSFCTVSRLMANSTSAISYCYLIEMCHVSQEAWPRGFWHGIILCCRSAAPSLCMAVSCLPMRITALSASTGNGMLWPAIHFACSAFNTDRKQCLLHTNQLEITLLSS